MRNYWLAIVILGCLGGEARAVLPRVQVVHQNSPAVVAVNVARKDGTSFTGTGFVLTPEGLIATSRHVTEGARYMNITFSNGRISSEAKIIVCTSTVDLCLLKIAARNLPTVTVASSARVMPGQDITVIGNPRRLQNTVSSGLISQVRQKSNGVVWHQISAPISPSSSGSPVFDTNGNVISVAFASYPGAENQNLNFAVPSDYLLQLVHKAGYRLPLPRESSASQTAVSSVEKESAASGSFLQAFWRHCQKSWELLLRIIHRIRTGA